LLAGSLYFYAPAMAAAVGSNPRGREVFFVISFFFFAITLKMNKFQQFKEKWSSAFRMAKYIY